MNLKSGFEERGARVEMIPLMDVMFLLLVFFIYSTLSMTLAKGMKVDLPHTAGSKTDQKPITVVISSTDEFYFEKEKMERDPLLLRVVRQYRETPATVLIRADRNAKLGSGIELLGSLKQAGVEKIVFETQKNPVPGK